MSRFDPCVTWLGISSPDHQPLDFYQLLGVDPASVDAATIQAAAVAQAAKVSPHLEGEHKAIAEQLLKQLTAARDCLSDPNRRAAYDQRLAGQKSKSVRKLKRAKLLEDESAQAVKPSDAIRLPGVAQSEPNQASDSAELLIDMTVRISPKTAKGKPAVKTTEDQPSSAPSRLRIAVGSAVAGSLALGLVVAIAGFWIASASNSRLVIQWPIAERHGGSLVVDGKAITPGTMDEITIPCEPGSHLVSVMRPEHELFLQTIVVEKQQRKIVRIDARQVVVDRPIGATAGIAVSPSEAAANKVGKLASSSPQALLSGTSAPTSIAKTAPQSSDKSTATVNPDKKPKVIAKNDPKAKPTTAAPQTAETKNDETKVAEFVLRVGGSWSGFQANEAVAPVFTKQFATPVRVFGVNSRSLFGELKSGRLDVLVYSPQSRTTLEKAILREFPPPEVPPKQFLFGQFAVQVIVHPTNPIEKLTYAQVRQAFAGQAKQWHALGETSRKVEPVGEIATSKAHEIVRREVMQGSTLARDLKTFRNSLNVAHYVSKHPGAIGFCIVTAEPLQKVKVLSLATSAENLYAKPTRETVMARRYPLVEELYLFTRTAGPSQAQEYCEFARGLEGAKAALATALIPAVEYAEFKGKQHLAERKAKRGDLIAVVGNEPVKTIVPELATEFTKSEKALAVDFKAMSSAEAAQAFLTGDADLLVLDDPLATTVIASAQEKSSPVKLISTTIGQRAVGVVINAQNRTREFTVEDLKAIWTGEVRRWPDTNQPIQIFALKGDQPVNVYLDAKFGPFKVGNATRRLTAEQVIRSVASRPGSMGFVDLKEMGAPGSAVLATVVGTLKEPKPPSASEIPQDYPLTWPVTVYRTAHTSAEAQRFVAFWEPKRLTPLAPKLGMFAPVQAPEVR